MSDRIVSRHLRFTALLSVLVVVSAATALADEACGLCNSAVVTTPELAACFLADYEKLAAKNSAAIVVDLSSCETSRGIAEALPSPMEALPRPNGASLEPDLQFMLSRVQLGCLKQKLEQPGLVLDPVAKIELANCE